MKSDLVYLEHIETCLNSIISYVDDLTETDFMHQSMVQDACIRQFEVMGEATKRLSMAFRESYPHIPWRQIAGFRDRLIHDYLNVDLTLVWQTAKYTVVDLLIEVETLLDNLRKLDQ